MATDGQGHLRNTASIDDLVLDHVITCCGSLLLVNPVRLEPLLSRDEAKFDVCIRQFCNTSAQGSSEGVKQDRRCLVLFKFVLKRLLVEEDPRVVEL